MIAIIDYGMGNLRSVQKALEKAGGAAKITQKGDEILAAEKIVLPGVGAMQPAMEKLQELNLVEPIAKFVAADKPFLGICLGLQLLFENSDEGGDVKGLGLLAGEVKRFTSLKVPHMGWNQLKICQASCPVLKELPDNTECYFCHSYYVQPKDNTVIATITDYGMDFTSGVARGNLFGVQFHPEKSQTVGLKILKNFVQFN